MLELRGVRLTQGTFSLTADFRLPAGAIISIMGPSGAGKSTLLSAIGGFLDPSQGEILWRGVPFTGLAPARRPVATIFQDHNLFPHLTAFQNAALGLTLNRRLSPQEADKVTAALSRVGLSGMEHRPPPTLSGGQLARVALARVLLMSKPILCLDEPFGALGPALKAEMIALVRDVARRLDATVLLVTHDPAEARLLGGQTAVVADGQVAPPAETGALLNDPPPALAAYLGGATDPNAP